MKVNRDPNSSPGDVIKQYLIDGLNLSVAQLARAIDVPTNRLYLIIQNKREISIDTAIRLGYFLNMDPLFWLNIQNEYAIAEYIQQ